MKNDKPRTGGVRYPVFLASAVALCCTVAVAKGGAAEPSQDLAGTAADATLSALTTSAAGDGGGASAVVAADPSPLLESMQQDLAAALEEAAAYVTHEELD